MAAVLVYNRLQERSARRAAQRAFGSSHADVLLDDADAGRREPTLEPLPRAAAEPPAAPAAPAGPLPDARVDYVIGLALRRPFAAAEVLEHWAALERRFGRRASLAAGDGKSWRRLAAGDMGRCTALRAALQLVSREGVAGDAELIEFRSEVETFGARLGASFTAPEMRPALEAARALDRVCAEADIQVALHVAGGGFSEEALAAFADEPFAIAGRADGFTLTLDVPRVPDVGRVYAAMARAAQQLAAAVGGRVVDDNGNVLDDRALAAIGAQVEAVRSALAEAGVETGSPLALRLFS